MEGKQPERQTQVGEQCLNLNESLHMADKLTSELQDCFCRVLRPVVPEPTVEGEKKEKEGPTIVDLARDLFDFNKRLECINRRLSGMIDRLEL